MNRRKKANLFVTYHPKNSGCGFKINGALAGFLGKFHLGAGKMRKAEL
jgi:hypothetical protein